MVDRWAPRVVVVALGLLIAACSHGDDRSIPASSSTASAQSGAGASGSTIQIVEESATDSTLVVDFARGESAPVPLPGEQFVYLARYEGMEAWPARCLPVIRTGVAADDDRGIDFTDEEMEAFLENARPIEEYPSMREEFAERSEECSLLASERDERILNGELQIPGANRPATTLPS